MIKAKINFPYPASTQRRSRRCICEKPSWCSSGCATPAQPCLKCTFPTSSSTRTTPHSWSNGSPTSGEFRFLINFAFLRCVFSACLINRIDTKPCHMKKGENYPQLCHLSSTRKRFGKHKTFDWFLSWNLINHFRRGGLGNFIRFFRVCH